MSISELKIKALLEGLEIQNIEKFMREAKVGDYINLGKAYVSATRNKIKEKKPLFITEDGVELFSDTVTLYAVDLDNQGIESPEWDFKECEKMGLKIFYYKKNADEYIWRNKRVFSYEDMMKAKHSIILTYEDIEKAAKKRAEQ